MGDIPPEDMESPIVGKVEELQVIGDRSSSSLASTPEQEEPHEQDLPHGQEQQQQKRKGGRKPIYATSEERKQRNRQAQAAFRERRTEYIKQLESTIKLHEETLQNLQQSHRSAADECLMLRYKNSLLERVLLEKGIDVQAELQQKGSSPNLGPTRMPVSAPLSQPIQRYAVNKSFHNRRSLPGLPHETDGATHAQAANMSPRAQPTSTSRISSPAVSATKSPNFLPQGGQTSPSFGPVPPQSQQLRPQQPIRPHFNPPQRPAVVPAAYPPNASAIGNGTGMAVSGEPNASAASLYAAQFQNHYDQLEQEYDAQADMIDDQDPSDVSAGAPPFPPPFSNGLPQQGLPQPQQQQPPQPRAMANGPSQSLQPQPQPVQAPDGNGGFGMMSHPFDPYDPMLDADPFGLSASMHFPTQFQFDGPAR